jgi:hypothetical protein
MSTVRHTVPTHSLLFPDVGECIRRGEKIKDPKILKLFESTSFARYSLEKRNRDTMMDLTLHLTHEVDEEYGPPLPM